ncbi:NAD(P)-dependent glycerol-3-phosphate dehydrogenase [Candidatus Sumerlaeota bacterium]|nr:NAD(P)-dependent glycerol-3-phosphate dehydrogenase [Candidatus Sumerlaeota bacterium]
MTTEKTPAADSSADSSTDLSAVSFASDAPLDIAVLGAGTWGIVLASLLSGKGHRVTAWDFDAGVVDALDRDRAHPKLPGFRVPGEIRLARKLADALASPEPDWLVVAVPSHGVRGTIEECREIETRTTKRPPWVLCAKGIEEGTLQTMTQVVESVCGTENRSRSAVLSGPSFAAEVAHKKPTTVCAASCDRALSQRVQSLFMTSFFRVYTQDDVLGAELGGAIKNVIAIAAGACDGLGLGDNARAALITRGLAEMVRLGVAMGARSETFAGLTGMGDLILTCTGELSRNRQFGRLLAGGRACQQALDEIGAVVEGMRTAHSVRELAAKHCVEMPISREIYAAIYEGKRPADAVRDLMTRDARPERD